MNMVLVMLLGVSFTFFMAVSGAAFVYCFKKPLSPRLKIAVFGVSAGIMLAASIWSLLAPSIAQSQQLYGQFSLLPILIGTLVGSFILAAFSCFDQKSLPERAEYLRARRLFLSMTLHNIPEGLSVGFAFGVALSSATHAAYLSAIGLALGVGLQNLPESLALALPIRAVTESQRKAFLYTVISCLVEPICAICGYLFALRLGFVQPWLLAFAAGAMLFVIFNELLPETLISQDGFGGWMVFAGFLMMTVIESI